MIYTVGDFPSERVAAGNGLSSSDGSRCQNKRDKESVTLSLGCVNGTRCTCAQESGDDCSIARFRVTIHHSEFPIDSKYQIPEVLDAEYLT